MTGRPAIRVLVAGKQGQVARCLADTARSGVMVVTAGRPEMDIADEESIRRTVERVRPDIVVNAAAYTAVDRAEDDADAARLVNEIGAGRLSTAAAWIGAPIVHLSTDYVFSGDKGSPYVETDACLPLSVYGRTKLDGEVAVRSLNERHVILRTAWVHSEFGSNFVKTMLRLAADRPAIRVVADQCGSPTYARDLAEALLEVCEHALARPASSEWCGTFHLTSQGAASWAEFATEIFRQSARLGGPAAIVEAISADEFPTRARRPKSSVLDCRLFEARFGHSMPTWKAGVSACLARQRLA